MAKSTAVIMIRDNFFLIGKYLALWFASLIGSPYWLALEAWR